MPHDMKFRIEPSHRTPVVSATDVVVCGGGPAGVSAAIAAARAGATTTLIESHGCLGGVWTAGLLSSLIDWQNKQGFVRELDAELTRRGARTAGHTYDAEVMKLLLEELCLAARVRIRLHTRVVAAARDGNRVVCAITESKSGREAWAGRVFIDATGDGDLAAQAGCGFDFGRDGQSQPMSLMAVVTGLRAADIAPCIYRAEEHDLRIDRFLAAIGFEPTYRRPCLFRIHDDLFAFMANHEPGSGLDAQSVTDATLRARAEIHRVVAALRQRGGPWSGIRLVATGAQIGVREGRRIHGRYCVTVDDVIRGARHDDAVCRVTFPVDIHAGNSFGNERVKHQPYDIPLRALIAKDANNLLLAGRCISGDFLAHGSYRVTGNAVAMGEAAGVAAAAQALKCRCGFKDAAPKQRGSRRK